MRRLILALVGVALFALSACSTPSPAPVTHPQVTLSADGDFDIEIDPR